MRLLKFFLIFICFQIHCYGLELENSSNLENVSLRDVKALILANNNEILKSRNFINADGIILLGVEMPGKSKNFLKKIERKFLGQSKDLSELKNAIAQYFNENGLEVLIEIPSQKLHQGILKLIIKKEEFIVEEPRAITKAGAREEIDVKQKSFENLQQNSEILKENDQIEAPKVSLLNIDALILVENPNILLERSFINANGILIVKAFIPGKKSDFIKRVEHFLNSSKELTDLENEIVKYFAEKNYDVTIDLPIQKFNQRLLKLVISSKEKTVAFQQVNENILDAEDPAKELNNGLADSKVQNEKIFSQDSLKIKPNKNLSLENFSLKNIRALILANDFEIIRSRNFINADGIILFGIEIPGNSKSFLKKLEKNFLGQSRNFQDLKNEIIQYFYENGIEIVIDVPSEKPQGVLKLIIKKEEFLVEEPKEISASKNKEEKNEIVNEQNIVSQKNLNHDQKNEIQEHDKIQADSQLPKVLLKNIEAIILASDPNVFNERSFINAKGILIIRAFIPGKKSDFVNRIEGFLNSSSNLTDLEAEIKNYFAEKKYDASIELPFQKYDQRLLKLVINSKENRNIIKNEEENLPLETINIAKDTEKEETKIEQEQSFETNQNIVLEEVATQETNKEIQEQEKVQVESLLPKISLKNIEAVVLVQDPNVFKSRSFINAKGVLIVGALIPGKKNEFVERIQGFLNSSDQLSDLEAEIKNYFNENNFDVSIDFPAQKFNPRILKLVVISKEKSVDENEKIAQQDIKESKLAKKLSKKKKEKNEIKKDEIKIVESQKIDGPLINAIILSSEKEESSDEINGVIVKNIDIPDFKFLEEKLTGYLNKPVNKEVIVQLKQLVLHHYKKYNRPFVLVSVPEQNISKGNLRFNICESKVGEICVVGNKYFSKKQYEIGLSSKDRLDEEKLVRNLNFLNRNPFRNVEMIYKEGKEQGTTDIELIAKEIRPIKIYYGAENTGLDPIGRNRFLAGIHLGNLFWSSQVLSYQITKSFSSNAFEAHTMQYTIPCPWGHMVYFYGGYSKVHADIPMFITAKNKGSSYQASARYEKPLKTKGSYTHSLIVGFDYKKTNNSAEFVELARFGQVVNLTQLYLTYEGNVMLKGYMSSFDMSVYVSPGKWLPHQSNADYKTIRLHSRSDYVYGTIGWKNLISFYRDFSLSFFLRGQIANVNLLPSEEFGIGGYNTVRGYDEREANGDHGLLLSTEIRLPSFSIFRYWNKKINDRLQFLGFVDYGKVWANEREVGLHKSVHLLGIGPGLRYVIDPYLSLRIDYGWKMHMEKDTFFKEKKRKLHFGLNVSF